MSTMKYGSTAIALALALALAAGCEKKSSDTSATQTTSAQQATSLGADDKEFLTKATQGSMLEVKLGRDISGRAQSPAVKAFADRMVTDHGKALDELRGLAGKKGVTLPSDLKDDESDMLKEMSGLSGAKLDEKYAKEMVDDHQKDVDEFREAAKNVKDPDLRAWAQKTLPILESHLAQAKDVKAKVTH